MDGETPGGNWDVLLARCDKAFAWSRQLRAQCQVVRHDAIFVRQLVAESKVTRDAYQPLVNTGDLPTAARGQQLASSTEGEGSVLEEIA